MIARARERLSSRDPRAAELTLADFALDKVDGDGSSALAGLFKVDHIQSQLQELRTTLLQCDRDGKDRSQYLESYLFLGNPGTGKTTVARAMAQILHELGVLGSNTIRACIGLDLQGSYIGQTKDKVNEIMAEAQGGVLFIDEAYTLGQGHYAQEAVDQLVALMTEPEHLNKTVVILAGYPKDMDRMLQTNEGVRSRFTGRIEFPDWDADDCVNHIRQSCERESIRLTDAAAQALLIELRSIQARPGWANARDSVSTSRLLYKARATRCANAAEPEATYLVEDVAAAMTKLKAQRLPGEPASAPIPAFQVHVGNFFDAAPRMASLPARPMQADSQRVEELFEEAIEEVEEEEVRRAPATRPEPPMDPVYAALLQACVAVGYDKTHEKRKELITTLEAVHGGGDFPDNIIDRVVEEAGLTKAKAHEVLRPQVHRVLDSMRAAVQQEEERLEELRRLEDEHRLEELRKKEEEHRRIQEQLRVCGACPMGYSWYRCGGGWRCTGGSHYKSDSQLGM